MGQVNTFFECGAQTATIKTLLIHDKLKMTVIKKDSYDFAADFETIFGKGVSNVELWDINKSDL